MRFLVIIILENIMIKSRRQVFPYSKGILTQSLMSAGITMDKAYLIAKAIEKKLHLLELEIIESNIIRNIASKALEVECGKGYAERYNLWRKFVKSDQSLIILIGGATGTGKSTLSSVLAQRLGITHIVGTDTLREVMRKILSKELFPSIHTSSYKAGIVLTEAYKSKSDRVIAGFEDHVRHVSVGIDAIIERSILENVNVIVEGIHIIPQFLKMFVRKNVICFFVTIEDKFKHQMRFRARETATKSRYASRYIASFDAIRTIQEFIVNQAKEFDSQIIGDLTIDDSIEVMYNGVIEKIKDLLK